ncbi:hypothetical protein AHAS_Ahas14G0110400 [Arachis hypogaea]
MVVVVVVLRTIAHHCSRKDVKISCICQEEGAINNGVPMLVLLSTLARELPENALASLGVQRLSAFAPSTVYDGAWCVDQKLT